MLIDETGGQSTVALNLLFGDLDLCIISFNKCNLIWDFLKAFLSPLPFRPDLMILLPVHVLCRPVSVFLFTSAQCWACDLEEILHLYEIHSWLQLKYV